MTRRRTRLGVVCLTVAALSAVAASAAAAKTVTKTATFNQCVSTAVPTVARGAIAATINVPVPKNGKKVQTGTVTAVGPVGTRVAHGFAGDLTMMLVSPAGTPVTLVSERDQEADGYGTGSQSCSGSPVLFGDTFPTPISSIDSQTTSDTPISGSFTPEHPLSGFLGGPARGFWTLVVTDCCMGDSGSVGALSLNLTYTYKVPAKKKGGR